MGRIDPDSVPVERGSAQPLGAYERRGLGDAGGLGQFGVAVETLSPGAQSSHRHWHSDEDEFLWMLVVTTGDNLRTLPIGLAKFVEQYTTRFELMMAGSVVSAAPVVIVFLSIQQRFLEGMAGLSGLK